MIFLFVLFQRVNLVLLWSHVLVMYRESATALQRWCSFIYFNVVPKTVEACMDEMLAVVKLFAGSFAPQGFMECSGDLSIA